MKSAGRAVGEQAADWQVGLVADAARAGGVVVVRVPRLPGQEELDEAHAAFDQAPRQPGAGMNTIGDVGNGHIRFVQVWPQIIPHVACHPSMQFRDCVAVIGKPERQGGRRDSGLAD